MLILPSALFCVVSLFIYSTCHGVFIIRDTAIAVKQDLVTYFT